MGTDGTAGRPLIFISYSHEDVEAKDFARRHLDVLQQTGTAESWDDHQIGIGERWFQEIQDKLQKCAVAVLLISTDFLRSEFCQKKEIPVLLERRQDEGMMIVPILLRPCAIELFPWLEAMQIFPGRDHPLLGLPELDQEAALSKVVVAIHRRLQTICDAMEEARQSGSAQRIEVDGHGNTIVQVNGSNVQVTVVRGDTPHHALPAAAVDLSRLPTGDRDLVGRDDELRLLNQAFDGGGINVVALVAWGGVGKSSLVRKWCDYLAADNYRGAGRVFGWSFYSQGTNERVTSADAFIDEALRFFGDATPEEGSAWARGERLAKLVGREKALLLLDGMEPLQDPHQGIKDPALARLVECLAAENRGLCVITTREPVTELEGFEETTKAVDLERLSPASGAALLRLKGVLGSDAELRALSDAFGNHALALNLLASYLRMVGDQRAVERENWKNAAVGATNLAELQLVLGEVAAAGATAEAAVEHADRSGDEYRRIASRTISADARHQAGALEAARILCVEAEAMLIAFRPRIASLIGFWNYRYSEILLALGEANEVLERSQYALDFVLKGSNDLLDIALDHLSLGQAALALGEREDARTQFEWAVEGLRNAGHLRLLPPGLLARAALLRETGDHDKARADLAEAMRLARRCGMRLFECDAHLEYARLLAEDDRKSAREHLAEAKRLVEACGYHRRDGEVAALEVALGG